MPIAKRLTKEERLNKVLPKGWRRAIRHPLIKKICYGGQFDPKPENVAKAIRLTSTWKGASWVEKVFTIALDIVMEKGLDVSVLDPDTYNRLNEHLSSNEGKMQSADWRTWHTWVWDVYNDHYGLHDLEAGELALPTIAKRTVKKRKPKLRRRKRKVAK